jgi:hypothetical protein
VSGFRERGMVVTGEFLRKTGPSRDSDLVYAAIQYTF